MAKQKRDQRRGSRKDPNHAREAAKYANPIPSREFIIKTLEAEGCPLGYEEIAFQLEISSDDHLEALDRRLRAMTRDGQLLRNRKGGFCVVNSQDLIAGRVSGHRDGFGFLVPDDGGKDLFLVSREMRKVMHGDRAVVRVSGIDAKGRREGAIVEVLERGHERIVGRLHLEGEVGFVSPENQRINHEIVIPGSELGGAKEGDIVVVELMVQPSRRTQPVGRIIEALGEHLAAGMETDVAIRSHEIPVEWPADVEEAIKDFTGEVPASAKKGRVDLRKLPLVTIDGEDARDFDDAVYCEATPKGWKLIVAIADVSSYVEVGGALDKEAHSRGNSVYFPDRVIPMLPEVLSNGLCSLNPEVDRLCMACEMVINKDGKIIRSRFMEAVMHSHARLTYNKAAAILVDQDAELRKKYSNVVPHLENLYGLYKVLQKARKSRGAIDFETVETRIIFGENGKIDNIIPVTRNDAHRVIEECMLAANVASARLLQRKKMPALYRIHEGPTVEKLNDLRQFLGEVGLILGGGDKPQAGDYAKLLEKVKGRADAPLIQTVLLRSLSRAVYSTDSDVGHFGLSFPAYTHFTSPIRRYPDLLVHRAIRHLVNGGTVENFAYGTTELQSFGEHCSTTERRADEATRDAMDTLKCEYLEHKVGDELDGVITSVTSFGLFVMLNDLYVDGLVHITSLAKDYFHFDPIGHRLTGERTGKVYRLGDPLRIKVAAVNVDDRKVDFMLADGGSSKEQPARTAKKKLRGPGQSQKKDRRQNVRRGRPDKSRKDSGKK